MFQGQNYRKLAPALGLCIFGPEVRGRVLLPDIRAHGHSGFHLVQDHIAEHVQSFEGSEGESILLPSLAMMPSIKMLWQQMIGS